MRVRWFIAALVVSGLVLGGSVAWGVTSASWPATCANGSTANANALLSAARCWDKHLNNLDGREKADKNAINNLDGRSDSLDNRLSAAEGKIDALTSQLGRVAFATNTSPGRSLDPNGSGNLITQLSAPITLASPGFLVIGASMDSYTKEINSTVGNEIFFCAVAVDGSMVTSSPRWVRVDGIDTGSGAVLINNEDNCATDAVVQVAAGSHTVTLVTGGVDQIQTVTDAMSLSAYYVPLNSTGQAPTGLRIVHPSGMRTRPHGGETQRRIGH